MLFLTHKMINFLFKKCVNDIDKDNGYVYVKSIVILKFYNNYYIYIGTFYFLLLINSSQKQLTVRISKVFYM